MLKVKSLLVVVCIAYMPTVYADPAKPLVPGIPAGVSAADAIAEINERIALLQAQMAEMEIKYNMAKKNDELKKLQNDTTDFNDTSYLPSVQEIDGVDGKLRALINLQGGKTQSVRVGDKASGWTVKKIKMDSVTLNNGKETVNIGFGGSALAEQK